MNKIGFNGHLMRRKPCCNKFLPHKVANSDIAGDVLGPSAKATVQRQHKCASSAVYSPIMVAAVSYCSPEAVIDAFFANLAIAKKRCSRTEQAVIVQRLDNGYTVVSAYGGNGGREHNKSVMNVYHIWLVLSE